MSAANTDFVLYLTAEDNTVTDKTYVNALAWGSGCRKDQHDRMVVARIHLFLKFLAFKDSQGHLSNNYLVTILAHELSHALGWTKGNFRTFRDEYGNRRKNAITYKKALGKTIALLSTPTVTKHVREHFGCNSLTGLELEDQHPGHSAGSHPEKRIFPESFMSSSILTMSNYHIDALTLSVFQDSGWYQVKYLEQAARLSFGRGMGCRVATHKCSDWGAEAVEKEMFCAERAQKFCMGRSKQVFGHCNIKAYPEALPSQFQYFPSTPNLGGKRDYPDYCPRPTEVWYSDCTDLNNIGKPKMDDASSGSQVGAESRCFLSSLVAAARTDNSVGARTDDSVARWPDTYCYRRTCKPNALQIHVGHITVSCPVSNKATNVDVEGYRGHLVCPAYAGLKDSRCTPTCSNNDPECLGIKGSMHSGMDSKPAGGKAVGGKPVGSNPAADDDIVVVHGRLRH